MELSLLSRCTLTALRKQPESKAVPVLKRLLVIKLQVQRVRQTNLRFTATDCGRINNGTPALSCDSLLLLKSRPCADVPSAGRTLGASPIPTISLAPTKQKKEKACNATQVESSPPKKRLSAKHLWKYYDCVGQSFPSCLTGTAGPQQGSIVCPVQSRGNPPGPPPLPGRNALLPTS